MPHRSSMVLSQVLAPLALVATLAACSHDGRELSEPTMGLPTTTTTTTPATATTTTPTTTTTSPTSTTTTTTPVREPIVIESLSSPANATAEVFGSGAGIGDTITVDGQPGDVLSFDVAADGTFAAQVWIEDEGAHTVCVADECGRVYTLAPDAETREEVIAKIDEALVVALDTFDYAAAYPDWSVEIGGALSGTGGTTDVDNRTVTIYRNRGRTLDDYVRTVLHEFGHVADYEHLDDADRDAYRAIRGIEPDTEWRASDAHRLDEWGRQPSEDFAEVMVMIWSDGRWLPRTELVDQPDEAQLAAISALVDADA